MRKQAFWPFGVLFISSLLYWGCQNTPESDTLEASKLNLEEILPGTWEAVSMAVEVNTAEGIPDSSYIFRINDGDWKSVFSVSPPRTYFEKDHKYRVEFIDRQDSIISVNRGMWNVFGDTLMMIEPNESFQYKVSEGKGLIFFQDVRDWDSDGEVDDRYQEVKRRISIGTQ